MARIHFFDKYYKVLGLNPDASNGEIKAAYRTLAKKYHPDRSGTEATREQFILVNEAYEMLMNQTSIVEALRQKIKAQDKQSTTYPFQRDIRQKATSHADMKFEAFAKTPIYRTAMAMNRAFDYLFIAVGFMMILAPVVGYFSDLRYSTERGEEAEFHMLPVVFGICFLYGLWYFLYRIKE